MTVEFQDSLCKKSLLLFTERAFPIIEQGDKFQANWHIDCICEHLEAVFSGQIRRLVINVPPRTLKTTIAAIMFPAWVWTNAPESKFITCSFKFERARSMSAKFRQIVTSRWYKKNFQNVKIDPSQAEKHNIHNLSRGQYYASSMSSVTGEGGDYVIVDDPLSPDDSLSDQIRNDVNETIRNTLFSRFNNPNTGRFVLIMQRLHDDDPSARLLNSGDGFAHLNLPAEDSPGRTITIGNATWKYPESGLLFEKRLGNDVLAAKRNELGPYNYAGQYLQRPSPPEGGELKTTAVRYYRKINPKGMNIGIVCDPAGGEEVNRKKKKTGDYTVFIVYGLGPDRNYYVLDMVRDRLNPTERVKTLFGLHRKWMVESGKNPVVGYEKYGMMSDTHHIREKMASESYNFHLIELGGRTPKETRIRKLIPILEANRLWLPENFMYKDSEGRNIDLTHELVFGEMTNFPFSKYDDMLDCASRMLDDDMQISWPKPSRAWKHDGASSGDMKESELYGSYYMEYETRIPWEDF